MSVRVTTDGQRVLLRSPFGYKDRAKAVHGAKWDGERKVWTYPLSMDTCRTLRRVFGQELLIAAPLADWARSELKAEQALNRVRSGAESARLDNVYVRTPDLYNAIANRSYQLTGAAVIERAGALLLGDQPGLGKTLQALAALVERGAQRILVFCPRTATRSVWMRETARWAPHITTYVAQGSRAQREKAFGEYWIHGVRQDGSIQSGPKMLICNTEMARVIPERCPDGPLKKCLTGEIKGSHEHEHDVAAWPFLMRGRYDAIVMDESHDSLASRYNVQSKNITQVRYGAMKLRRMLAPNGIALAMSGTPARSKLERFWGTLNWLDPAKFSSFWRFAETHFEVTEGKWGREIGTYDPQAGRKIAVPLDPETFSATLRPYYLARTKADVAQDLPPIQYAGTPINGGDQNYVQIDMEAAQAKAYDEMRAWAETKLGDERLTATGVLAVLTRLRQFALSKGRIVIDPEGEKADRFVPDLPSAKLEWILDFMAEHETGKVVIASSFTAWIELLSEKLAEAGYENMTLTGKTSDRQRAELVRRFQDPDDTARIAIINTKAGGTAITLDAADDMIITDLPWTADDEEQVTDRIHRVSRIHQVTVYRLVSEGTVDAWMAGLTEVQREALRTLRPDRDLLAGAVAH